MSTKTLYRAERCRDLAEECCAIAALCAPSTEMRIHYFGMTDHYSSLAEAEELGTLAYGCCGKWPIPIMWFGTRRAPTAIAVRRLNPSRRSGSRSARCSTFPSARS
jgi:hypothetical protein